MSKSRSGATKRVAAGLLAGALSVFGVALSAPAGAIEDTGVERVAGATRYGTAAAIAAEAEVFDGADTAILASGENFPDALAASGLAGANAPAPIFLTPQDSLDNETLAGLDEGGYNEIIVVGGTAAVGDDVVATLEEEGYSVTRVAGTNRYETAAEIAEAAGTPADLDGLTTAIIATGTNYPDALAGGPLAYAGPHPILLTDGSGVPAATQAALESLDVEQVVILGGTAAVSEATAADLEEITGNDAIRLAGVNRFATAVEVARAAIADFGFTAQDVLLASGVNFPDALAGGPLGGELLAPVLLSSPDGLSAETEAFLDELSADVERILVLGGPAAIADATLEEAETAAETTDNDAATGGDTQTDVLDGPELQSASISGIDLDDLAIFYTFVFDEDVDEDTVDPALFKLYNADTRVGNQSTGAVYNGGDDIEVDGNEVDIIFNLADYGVANATLAAVEEGAVEDEDGNQNPPQSVETAGAVNDAGTGLVSAEVTDEEDGIVEYTFGSPIIPGTQRANDFKVIDRDGTTYTIDAFTAPDACQTSPDEDEPSTTVECDFPEDFSDNNLRRAVVKSNSTLTPAASADVRINAVDLSGGGTTDAPDLVSVQFAADNDDLDDNEALFIFDEAIDTSGATPSAFDLVYSHCNPSTATTINTTVTTLNGVFGGTDYDTQDGEGFDDTVETSSTCAVPATSVTLDGDNNRAVLATFATDDIDNQFLIAAQVAEGNVSEAAVGNLSNDDDEVELTRDDTPFEDGEVAGPQLVGADVEIETTSRGDFRNFLVTLTFDKNLDEDTALAGEIVFWYEESDQVEREALTLGDCEVDDDTNIVCEISDEDSNLALAEVIAIDQGTVTGADVYTIDSDELAVQFPNPEASIEIEVPEVPESE